MKYCGGCGHPTDEEQAYCVKCGKAQTKPTTGEAPAGPVSDQGPSGSAPPSQERPEEKAANGAVPKVKISSLKPRRVGPKMLAGGGLGLVLLVALVLALTGGADIRNDEGEIGNAEDFLTSAQREWRSELPDQHISMSDDAACFYLLDDEDLITGKIACGGARRAGAADGNVWDMYSYSVFMDEDGNQTAAELEPGDVGASRPSGQLVNVDGDEPAEDVDALAAPPLPRAPSGLAVADAHGKASVTDTINPGEAGRVITPGGTLQVTSVATQPTVASQQLSGTGAQLDRSVPLYGPAEGETFRRIEMTFQSMEWDAWSEETPEDVTVSFRSAGQQTELRTFSYDDFTHDEAPTFSSVVSAREGAELVISSAGHDQVIDLATGKRAADPVADTYYRRVTKQDVNEKVNFERQTVALDGDQDGVRPAVTVNSVELTPYAPSWVSDQGWATSGNAWALVSFDAKVEFNGYTFNSDDGSTLTWSAGGPASEVSKDISDYDESYVVALEVPSDSTSVELSVASRVEVWSALNDKTKFVDFTPQTLKVDFPR